MVHDAAAPLTASVLPAQPSVIVYGAVCGWNTAPPELMATVDVPVLVSFTDCATLVVPTLTLPKSSAVLSIVTEPPGVPLPLSATSFGEPAAPPPV